ncbi:secreted metalloprotease [Candidatus Magnetobacterium bavaricum]|uniref:Secreted metalloprotease n=1 Tax=Candidatus Magnetobacterium bavaricum TaxID=29290 RepID=A0A0F3GKD5_9BACT|nr:secreted metalloprotease [Candidatus Magnetobacterium bavaricum]
MKKGINAFIVGMLILLVAGMAALAEAVPAAPDSATITQPDGSSFEARQRGDEWHNWVETVDGYSVVKADDGYWYYISTYSNSTPVLTGVKAHLSPPVDLNKHIMLPKEEIKKKLAVKNKINPKAGPNGAFSGKVLFILVEFSNKAHTPANNEAAFATLLSTDIADYYSDASYGNVTLTPATESSGTANNGVIDWINLATCKSTTYNHPNTGSTTGVANQQLAKDAIECADTSVNFAAYDTNSDGYVDTSELAVVIIAAGYEASMSGAPTPNLWGHQWSISTPPQVDGKYVGAYHNGAGGYAMFGEVHSSGSNPHIATIGIMVHELGHLIFDWVDLYDTDDSSEGIGAFSLMSAGSWGKANNDTYSGKTPVLPCAYDKYLRGWVSGSVGSGTVSITAAGHTNATSANTVYRATTSDSNQYFLVENRQAAGYDLGLEKWLGTNFGGGLAIFHIDTSQTDNTSDTHRLVNLETADNYQMTSGNKGQNANLWRSGNATTFNNSSTPNSKLYNGSASLVSIASISATGTTMTAVFSTSTTSVTTVPTLDAWSIIGIIGLSSIAMYRVRRREFSND